MAPSKHVALLQIGLPFSPSTEEKIQSTYFSTERKEENSCLKNGGPQKLKRTERNNIVNNWYEPRERVYSYEGRIRFLLFFFSKGKKKVDTSHIEYSSSRHVCLCPVCSVSAPLPLAQSFLTLQQVPA